MKAKNCLIFGGSGQIGRNLIRKLTKNNYRVIVVTRNIHQKSNHSEDRDYFFTTIRKLWTMKEKATVLVERPFVTGVSTQRIKRERSEDIEVFPVVAHSSDGLTAQCSIRFMDRFGRSYPPPVFSLVNVGLIKKVEDSRMLIPFCEYKERYTPTFRMMSEVAQNKILEVTDIFHNHLRILMRSGVYQESFVDLDDAFSDELFPTPFVNIPVEKQYHIKYLFT